MSKAVVYYQVSVRQQGRLGLRLEPLRLPSPRALELLNYVL